MAHHSDFTTESRQRDLRHIRKPKGDDKPFELQKFRTRRVRVTIFMHCKHFLETLLAFERTTFSIVLLFSVKCLFSRLVNCVN